MKNGAWEWDIVLRTHSHVNLIENVLSWRRVPIRDAKWQILKIKLPVFEIKRRCSYLLYTRNNVLNVELNPKTHTRELTPQKPQMFRFTNQRNPTVCI